MSAESATESARTVTTEPAGGAGGAPEAPGPLAGIRVIDLAGPMAEATGRVLADLGAEVIKVEPPGGCASRFTPPFVANPDNPDNSSHAANPGPARTPDTHRHADPELSLFWRAWGLGKHSVVLDIHEPADRETLRDLIRSADVFVESETPGALEALSLGAAELQTINPTLVHVSITPYGQTGPEALSPATDLTLAAAGGFLNCQGDRDRPPVPIGHPETSCSAAVQAAADAIMALCERQRSGLGQHLDASMQAAVLWTLLLISGYGSFGLDAPGMGDDRADPPEAIPGLTIPVFARTADGFLGMTLVLGGPGSRSLGRMMAWAASEGAIEADLAELDWSKLFEYLSGGRVTASDAQRGIDQLVAFFGTRTKREIHERAVAGRWLVAPAWDAADLLADPQLAARDYWTDVDGTIHPGPFARLSETPIRYRCPAPTLGQHQHLVRDATPPRRPTVYPPAEVPNVRRRPVFEALRIADFSWVGAGPLVSKDLANLGATVVRIESESFIDPLRIIPPWKDGIPNHATGHSMANFNQSKFGLALDLGNEQTRAVVEHLVNWADVVIESFVPGTAAKFGLDYETLRNRKPGLVMLSSCMRGQTGPERLYTGFGLQGAALAGLVALTGWPDRLPVGPFAAYSDFISPRYSQAALAAALYHRDRTGQGQYIDLSQVEAAIHLLAPVVLDYTVNGTVTGLRGNDSDRACPHGVYRTAGVERFVAIAVETPTQWRALRAVFPGLARAAFDGLDDLETRTARGPELDAALAQACVTEEPFALAERLRRAGTPASVVARATDLHADSQLLHREFFVELDHPRIGRVRYDGPVTRFSATPHHPTHAGPTIGQHTFEVLRDMLGYTDDEISELAATGALT